MEDAYEAQEEKMKDVADDYDDVLDAHEALQEAEAKLHEEVADMK